MSARANPADVGLRVFCTLFDSNYLSRGLAMYQSLARHAGPFLLYVFAFDDAALAALRGLALENVVVVPLAEFEDRELLRVKPSRSRAEYCWTCTPSTLLWVLEERGHPVCTYLDADTCFFSSPDPLLAELGASDVIITEHRYSPQHDYSATSGIYNVQFVTARASERGLRVLRWWRDACLDSCELNPAEGKCGDQKYLDDWPQRFEGIHVLQHRGGGLAPWNVQQYVFRAEGERIVGTELRTGSGFDVIFFHFHALKLTTHGRVHLSGGGYEIGRDAFQLLYVPYIRSLDAAGRMLRAHGVSFDPHGRVGDERLPLRTRARLALRRMVRWPLRPRGAAENCNVPHFLDELV